MFIKDKILNKVLFLHKHDCRSVLIFEIFAKLLQLHSISYAPMTICMHAITIYQHLYHDSYNNGWTNISILYIYPVRAWNLAFHECKSIKSDDVTRYTCWVSDIVICLYKYLIWWLHAVICRIYHMDAHIYVDIINDSKSFLRITWKLKLNSFIKRKKLFKMMLCNIH